MPEPVDSTSPSPAAGAQDPDAAIQYLVLSNLFTQMLKKPESDEEGDSVSYNEVNKGIANAIAQSATGFGP